ncbi:MAG: two-component sensor histidine kinase, partial [Clostridiales bacterium]|nr:two-component sensor histidine kinase [Clostridiales bacterium]
MDGWIIVTKLLILIYCTLEYTSGDMQDSSVVLLLVLFNISLNMLFYIFKKEGLKKLFLFAAAIFLIFSALQT